MLAWAVLSGRASSSPPPEQGLKEELQDVLQEEVWRAGGPRQDRMLAFFEQAIASGKPEAVAPVEEVLWPLFARRWLDPRPFAEYLPQLRELSRTKASSRDLASGWPEEIALWDMPASERQRAYSQVLSTGRPNDELGLAWNGAAYRAMLEEMDNLLPLIEATMEKDPNANYQKAETKVPRADLLELARARSGDCVQGYIGLIRQELEEQQHRPDPDPNSFGNRLIREALLELVHADRKELLAPLKGLWRSIPNPEMSTPEKRQEYARYAARGFRDPDYPRTGPAADHLVRAIQALGDPSFQEKNSGRRELLKSTRKRLVEAGWLRSTVEAQ
ncbi:MAG: hypothetical protein A2Y78_06125 [Acidobacteria bacterium RBG_13_68_16]|nr:MAG: hypothetical protein A2Y78_06125 [Acidobacteria bacterium RBG_13_68_16]